MHFPSSSLRTKVVSGNRTAMAELPEHVKHLAGLSMEEAKAKVKEERYKHCANMSEDEMLTEIFELSQERRRAAGGISNVPTASQLQVMKDLYKTFKYRGNTNATSVEPEIGGRTMDPPLFKPYYPPSPQSGAMTASIKNDLHRSLQEFSLFQQDVKGEQHINPSNGAAGKLETPMSPASGMGGEIIAKSDMKLIIFFLDHSSDSFGTVDEGRHPDAFGLTPSNAAYNRMKNSFNVWAAKQEEGTDVIPTQSGMSPSESSYIYIF